VDKITVLLVGGGGYGSVYLHELLHKKRGEEYQLVGVVDPYIENCKYIDELHERNIPFYNTLEDFYSENTAQLALIATPIFLHGVQSRYCMEHGSHVLCEKPICATVEDANAMQAVRDKSGKKLGIGFQGCYSDAILKLKEDLLNGVYGKIKRIRTLVYFPRALEYYQRSSGWAGKKCLPSGEWILDAVASNATAHYLQNMLFLAGKSYNETCEPQSMQAEVYRANPIEMYDTCALRIDTEEKIEVLFYATHAVPMDKGCAPEMILEAEKGTVIQRNGKLKGKMEDGTEIVYGDPYSDGLKTLDYMKEAILFDNPLPCELETAMSHLKCVYAVAQSFPEPPAFKEGWIQYIDDPAQYICKGLEETLEQCWKEAKLPYEMQYEWALEPQYIEL